MLKLTHWVRQYFNISECILLIGKDQVDADLGTLITNVGRFIYKLLEIIENGYLAMNTTFSGIWIIYPKKGDLASKSPVRTIALDFSFSIFSMISFKDAEADSVSSIDWLGWR